MSTLLGEVGNGEGSVCVGVCVGGRGRYGKSLPSTQPETALKNKMYVKIVRKRTSFQLNKFKSLIVKNTYQILNNLERNREVENWHRTLANLERDVYFPEHNVMVPKDCPANLRLGQ